VRHVAEDGLLVCLAMAQEWFRLTIYDHVLGVTGLVLHLARQLARSIPVDLPLLHGAAIGHDVGKFGCVRDEVKRIPRLHYYYTHIWYQDRDLPSLGHIATNHSCWDLELVRLPVETMLLIYADFRVKDSPDPSGRQRMQIITLREAYDAILGKLENVDRAKAARYARVYRKLRNLEEYMQYLGVELSPPAFVAPAPPKPQVPAGLDVLEVLAGRQRPDAVALATGRTIPQLERLLVTAHNLEVMERLRDLPALRTFIEEARSFENWRDVRTYEAVLADYAQALSTEQKDLALDFFVELLSHRDDDIRYHAANHIGDLLSGTEDFWRKDLPDGVVLRQERRVLDEMVRVLALFDRAGKRVEEDMRPTERVLYAIPIVVRRLLRKLQPPLRWQAWDLIRADFDRRLDDERPLVGLYVCEACEVALPHLDPPRRRQLIPIARAWARHESTNTRLMAWRVLLGLAREGRDNPGLLDEVRACAQGLDLWDGRFARVAELHVLEELATICGLVDEARRVREQQVAGRDPVRQVLLGNLKTRIGWVEKKVNCDYLTAVAHRRHVEDQDLGAYFANEVASHFANILKVSRVEGTRFHAGRCLLRLLPLLSVPQRNELMVELLRSLEQDAEAIARYIPRFLGPLIASLPEQEFAEALDDIEGNVRRGNEALQRLLLQTVAWVLTSLDAARLGNQTLQRLCGALLGPLAETRHSTVNEAWAQIALVLDRLAAGDGRDGRLRAFCAMASKKLLSMVTHRPGDRVRFFVIASALNQLERATEGARPALRFAARPKVALIPGTFDPFTAAHQAIVSKALEHADEVLVQVDDYSWRKHALPRELREELAWMALAPVPNAFLAPFRPPINLASPAGLRRLQRAVGRRELALVVGTDVISGASAYAAPDAPIWDIPHVIIAREGRWRGALEQKMRLFRGGASVVAAPREMERVSSTALRAALDRREEPEMLCHPLVSRTLVDRGLYINYPAEKRRVAPPAERVSVVPGAAAFPAALNALATGALPARSDAGPARAHRTCLLTATGDDRVHAAIAWREISAALLPVAVVDEETTLAGPNRLLGQGALVEALGARAPGRALERLLDEVMARWLDAGLLFAVVPVNGNSNAELAEALALTGASGVRFSGPGVPGWAVLRLDAPLVLVWDLESVLQPSYAAALPVRRALEASRRELARFFAQLNPGAALLHVHEDRLKQRVADEARERLAAQSARHVVLGVGRQFSRDIVGDLPSLAVDLERFLTWQGYEGGTHPHWGSAPLDLQLAVARELSRDAVVLAPFLANADPVLQVVDAAKRNGLRIGQVVVGVTDAATRAALELRGIRHHCGAVVPGWRGVLRESALTPYLGGWSIAGRGPLECGSLLPSLNDCLPYHYPHHLGLGEAAALDFSRLALEQARRLLLAVEDAFREAEGRLLSVHELGAVVRVPRCPPFSRGFQPARNRLPSELLAEDIEALARLHPEGHAAHRGGWSRP
ncbi:MAG: adenylyltransferase/cytidyltransferase family protein, partial [Acidobacteria bacterium]|nr:adenylyltransferase/cytidyltransferase family protein [Acidobacteriota bacterium]